jgi:hypothetical protein
LRTREEALADLIKKRDERMSVTIPPKNGPAWSGCFVIFKPISRSIDESPEMAPELYAPRGTDKQEPHDQDDANMVASSRVRVRKA